jgi:hypothetical protein
VPDKAEWETVPDQREEFEPILMKIMELFTTGLTGMMVVADFLHRWIAPLQQRSHGAWMYTGINHVTHMVWDRTAN